MQKPSKNASIGFALVAVGAGFAVAGLAVLAPVCFAWSRNLAQEAYRKGRKGVLTGIDEASARLRDVAERAQGPLSEAAKAARHTTAIAAGAVESAAHYVREQVSSL